MSRTGTVRYDFVLWYEMKLYFVYMHFCTVWYVFGMVPYVFRIFCGIVRYCNVSSMHDVVWYDILYDTVWHSGRP